MPEVPTTPVDLSHSSRLSVVPLAAQKGADLELFGGWGLQLWTEIPRKQLCDYWVSAAEASDQLRTTKEKISLWTPSSVSSSYPVTQIPVLSGMTDTGSPGLLLHAHPFSEDCLSPLREFCLGQLVF